MRRRSMLAIVCLVMVLLVPGVREGVSQSQPTETPEPGVLISLRPSTGLDGERFTADVNAGESTTLTAVISNFGAEPIELRTYTSDVVPVANGGIAVAGLESERHEPTTWMDYSTEVFTLSQGQEVNKEFTITVPEGTPAGQYVNALILETVNPVDQGGSSPFEQYFRKVVSVYITVPGPIEPGIAIGEPFVEIQGTVGLVVIPVSNVGNIRLDLTAVIVVTDASGTVILESSPGLGPIYAGQSTVVQTVLPVVPPPGDYLISVSLSDEATGVTEAIEDVTLTVPEAESGEVAPIAFENVSILPDGDPIQFATVSVDVVVSQQSFRSSRLTMGVFHNGELVEDFVLAENLSLAQGTTTVQQRYLPATGWQPGTYTFSLKLESTEGEAATVLLTQDNVATIEVP